MRVSYRQWWGPCLQRAQLIWPDCLLSSNGLCGRIPWDIKYVRVNWGRLKNRLAFRRSSNDHTSPSCSRQKIKNDQYPNHFFQVLPSVNLFWLFFSLCQAWFYKPWKNPFLQTQNCIHSCVLSLFLFNLSSSVQYWLLRLYKSPLDLDSEFLILLVYTEVSIHSEKKLIRKEGSTLVKQKRK